MAKASAYNLHLVSDSSGETVNSIARACLVQYKETEVTEHFWSLVRTKGQIKRVVEGIKSDPGIVVFTLLDSRIRAYLEGACQNLGVPCVSVLDPVMQALQSYLKIKAGSEIGRQHMLDDEYFNRIDAMQYALQHDDGQALSTLKDADIILVGVSRTSKTPTCMYLANRGFRAGNIPLVPGFRLSDEVVAASRPLFVGLTREPKSLSDIRQNRLRIMKEDRSLEYADIDSVRLEVASSRRLFEKHSWPVIDVTRKSIEETAASIIQLFNEHRS